VLQYKYTHLCCQGHKTGELHITMLHP
jgi:hypothetical protein